MDRVLRLGQRYVFLLVDTFYILLSYFSAFYFIYNSVQYLLLRTNEKLILGGSLIVYLIFFIVFRTYRKIWKHSGIEDYFYGIAACTASVLVLAILSMILHPSIYFTVKIHVLACLFIMIQTIGTRILLRIENKIASYIKSGDNIYKGACTRLLILGAGCAAEIVIAEINRKPRSEYKIVGILDDDASKVGCMFSGIKVQGTRNDIVSVCKKYNVDEILLAIPSLTAAQRAEILQICNTTKAKIKILPGIDKIILSKNLLYSARNVEIEDLLGRDPVQLNNHEIAEYIKGNTVFVSGAGGSIGSELCRQIAKYSPGLLIIFDIYENTAYDLENELKDEFPQLSMKVLIGSVRDQKRIDQVFHRYSPDIVFHAAAHKHVPLMETSPIEAIKNNVFGTFKLAKVADKYKVKRFILISTDKAVNPTNVMGATKRLCEMIIQAMDCSSDTHYAAVRFGNVLGSNGSVIPLFKKQLASGGPLKVTHREVTRFFMTIPEAAQLVLQAATYARGGEIFVLDMGEPVKIYDLAEKLIRLSGLEPHIDINIEITGLRPGEKLYEELLMADEGLRQTSHSKIFIAKPAACSMDQLEEQLQIIEEVIKVDNDDEVKKALSAIVPTYQASPKRSIS